MTRKVLGVVPRTYHSKMDDLEPLASSIEAKTGPSHGLHDRIC